MGIGDFRDLIVWQKAHQLFLDIARDIDTFPVTQTSKIVIDQLVRSCSSISANIAEGFGRRKGREYLHYLIIARGSTMETLNWLIKSYDIGWMDKEVFKNREEMVEEIMKMLNKMIGQKIKD